MTTRQQTRRDKISNTLNIVSAQREATIARLVKLEAKAAGLRKQLARAERSIRKAELAELVTQATREHIEASAPAVPPVVEVMVPVQYSTRSGRAIAPAPSLEDDAIPGFLDRRTAAQKADAEARERIERENAERKSAKAKTRIEKLKIRQEVKRAKLTGELKKMPLTGKAALAFIRQ